VTDGAIITGRARIAHEAKRSERTITEWVKRGVLPAVKSGPFENSVLEVRRADLERIVHREVDSE
jgi:hypothetical protein